MKTLILGLGNDIRGDDGLPFYVIDKLEINLSFLRISFLFPDNIHNCEGAEKNKSQWNKCNIHKLALRYFNNLTEKMKSITKITPKIINSIALNFFSKIGPIKHIATIILFKVKKKSLIFSFCFLFNFIVINIYI